MIEVIEDAIVQRLSAGGVRAVAASSQDDFEKIRAPAYVVVFDGLSVRDAASARDVTIADVSWLVVAVARNAVRPQDGGPARRGVLSMFENAFSALAGWKPDGAMRALRFVSADGIDFDPPAAMLPIRFSCEIQLRKE